LAGPLATFVGTYDPSGLLVRPLPACGFDSPGTSGSFATLATLRRATSAFAVSLLSPPIHRSVILNQFVQTARSGCVGRVRGKLNFEVETCLIDEIPQLVMDVYW